MGQLDHEVEARQSAVEEIVRQYPGATVAWDLKLDPYMIVVSVNGSIVRAFVERRTLIERGATYEAFMRKLSEQVIDSQRVIELLGRDEKEAPAADQGKPLGPAGRMHSPPARGGVAQRSRGGGGRSRSEA